ncbi:MAG TPA: TldD/PmbA family protein [Bacillota bacterium]|nr:TldD/PmbA family protein [Bacillota bacterium]HPZ22570.1 TldD/PmbA family protein [Bacillota bacterium]
MLKYGLDAAIAAGADYAEITGVDVEEEKWNIENARPSLSSNREKGIAVRLLAAGRWGFAAAPATNKLAVNRLVKAAMAGANVRPALPHPVELSTVFPAVGSWTCPCQEDPFAIPRSQLLELLRETDGTMAIGGIELRRTWLHFRREHRHYLNSEGSANQQAFTLSGGGISALAFGEGEIQQRSWPSPQGSYAGRGYEYIKELDLPGHGRQMAEEAIALTKAPACPQEVMDVILLGPMLAAQIHYTLGRRLQLGMPESTYSSQLRLSSQAVSLDADASLPGGAGSFGFDAEGVKAQTFPLLEKGRVVNYFTGRETAAATGRFSSGCMRSPSWSSPPLPWMTNVILRPGACSLADLAGGIKRGILLDTPRSFTVNPLGSGFAAQAEIGWMIEGGLITQMVKNPFYRGNAKAFWSGCDAAAATAHQRNLGIMDNGIAAGHSVVPVRIRGVRVGDRP